MAAQLDRASLRIIEPVHQPDQGRLAGAARSNHTECFAPAQVERYVLNRWPVSAFVPERDSLERDLRADVGQRSFRRRLRLWMETGWSIIPNTLCAEDSTVIPWWYRLVSSRMGLNTSTPSIRTISNGRNSMSPSLTRTAPTASATRPRSP